MVSGPHHTHRRVRGSRTLHSPRTRDVVICDPRCRAGMGTPGMGCMSVGPLPACSYARVRVRSPLSQHPCRRPAIPAGGTGHVPCVGTVSTLWHSSPLAAACAKCSRPHRRHTCGNRCGATPACRARGRHWVGGPGCGSRRLWGGQRRPVSARLAVEQHVVHCHDAQVRGRAFPMV